MALVVCLQQTASAQGCVAIRSNGATSTLMGYHPDGDHSAMQSNGWTLGINARYFRSYKHFVGTKEQHERVENGSEVINHFTSTEFGLTRQLNNRWQVAFYAPIINNIRSSMYEHYGNGSKNPMARRETRSFGLGDVRLAAYYWVADPVKASKFNLQLGAGIKLPTGDYRVQDYFYRNDSTKLLGYVDQSIQLGDGGTGLTLEANTYYNLSRHTSIYANSFYLFNPREHNGINTGRGGTPSATAIAYGTDVMSVPDQFMWRAGANFTYRNFSISGGLRYECVPSEDAIGGSNGFRRPGYIVSVEPGITYQLKKVTLFACVPVAIERNRIQSVPDKIRTDLTGTYTKGDAAFADYLVNVGASFRF